LILIKLAYSAKIMHFAGIKQNQGLIVCENNQIGPYTDDLNPGLVWP